MRPAKGCGAAFASAATALVLSFAGLAGCSASPAGETAVESPPRSPASPSATASDAASSRVASPDATAASAAGSTAVDPESGLRWISQAELPSEALQTLQLIESGGPYPYDRDGVTFENREGLLPGHPVGYYREFTVETPGSDDRGARRIVVGDGGEWYYTDDHYDSFTRISR